MKYVFLNLKRFDIPVALGGINKEPNISRWGGSIISGIQDKIKKYQNATFAAFLPEAHILDAVKAKSKNSPINIGCQSVHHDDVKKGGNFGAFTTARTAKSAKALGCNWTIIGHCEERRDILNIMKEANAGNGEIVSKYLNKKIKSAISAGLNVLYCVGETAEEQANKYEVIRKQILLGLNGVDCKKVVVAYEPTWAIGPGKTPPDKDYIEDITKHIKKSVSLPVVYGGGLKQDNASMLASIDEIDGGLIALTRFKGDIGFYPNEYIEIVSKYLGDE